MLATILMKLQIEDSLKIAEITDRDGFTLILRTAYDNVQGITDLIL